MCLGSSNGYIMCTTAVNLNEKKKPTPVKPNNYRITLFGYNSMHEAHVKARL